MASYVSLATFVSSAHTQAARKGQGVNPGATLSQGGVEAGGQMPQAPHPAAERSYSLQEADETHYRLCSLPCPLPTLCFLESAPI